MNINRVLGPFSALVSHGSLTRELTRRDVLGRYRGASFGMLWTLISPFLMLCIYTFAFGTVTGGRWPEDQRGNASFSIILFAGLIVHGLFAECLTKAPSLIVGNANFVKKVVFPLDVLPWVMTLSALFHALTNTLVFVLLHFIMDGAVPWTIVFLPLVLLPLVVLSLGTSWFLASLGVYLRDVVQVIGVISTALLFLSSAVIPLSSVPPAYRWVFELNPLTFVINQAREVMLWGHLPNWAGLGWYLLGAVVVMYAGYGWFRLTQRGFSDVL